MPTCHGIATGFIARHMAQLGMAGLIMVMEVRGLHESKQDVFGCLDISTNEQEKRTGPGLKLWGGRQEEGGFLHYGIDMALQARGGTAQNFSRWQGSTLWDQHIVICLEGCTYCLQYGGGGERQIVRRFRCFEELTLNIFPCFRVALGWKWLSKKRTAHLNKGRVKTHKKCMAAFFFFLCCLTADETHREV